jgi:2-keto-3-deoxy-6-phosphogluconate aldolase
VEVAVARGVELALMGCLAIEVTLDSPLWREVLAGLKGGLPPHVLLGVGTVMDETVSQVATAASLSASFALSPIDPVGFVDECPATAARRRAAAALPLVAWRWRVAGALGLQFEYECGRTPPTVHATTGTASTK